MKIILDIDGTLTDFRKFIKENAIEYFKKNYNMEVRYPDKLEIEDIFDIKNTLINEKKLTPEQAEKEMQEMLDKFWVSFVFVKFSLLNRFRPGVTKVINKLISLGHDIQVYTSRSKTCNSDMIGTIARKFTIWQFWVNGIFLSEKNFHFFSSDNEKVANILLDSPQLVFEDKSEIVKILEEYKIPTLCVSNSYNAEIIESKMLKKIEEFDEECIFSKMTTIFGKKLEYYNKVASSDKFFLKISKFRPLLLSYFSPIILNEHNIIQTVNYEKEGIVFAPNHRSTLDPLVITAYLNRNIHWAALLRFFTGKDSIFNNSKNPILCKITAECFKKLEYFPIDRKSDNPDANNFDAIKNMNYFLKINSNLGIFGEGTTRRPENQDFGTFDDSFLALAKKNNSWVQPITSLWLEELGIKPKVIINFGTPFKVSDMDIDTALEYFLEIQQKSLQENKEKCEELVKQHSRQLKK